VLINDDTLRSHTNDPFWQQFERDQLLEVFDLFDVVKRKKIDKMFHVNFLVQFHRMMMMTQNEVVDVLERFTHHRTTKCDLRNAW
jgi:hypothetical protein